MRCSSDRWKRGGRNSVQNQQPAQHIDENGQAHASERLCPVFQGQAAPMHPGEHDPENPGREHREENQLHFHGFGKHSQVRSSSLSMCAIPGPQGFATIFAGHLSSQTHWSIMPSLSESWDSHENMHSANFTRQLPTFADASDANKSSAPKHRV